MLLRLSSLLNTSSLNSHFIKCLLKRELSTSLGAKIDGLKRLLSKVNTTNHYEYLLNKNKNLAKFPRASVLVPISFRREQDEWISYYTLSKRTDFMRSHKGQVCFVGGKQDKTDKNEIETAFREAKEEINIDKESLTFLAQTCPILTSASVVVTPIICFFDKSNFNPLINEHEVELIFDLPTDRFLSSTGHTSKQMKSVNGDIYYIHYFEDYIEGRKITTWGLTAYLCILISSYLHQRNPSFPIDPIINFKYDQLNEFTETYLLKVLQSLSSVKMS
jgi:coenzyme A diphosphatase NUDT7